MDIKDRIKALRKNHGMTQSQLAVELDVTLRCVQNYESGSRYPRRGIIEKICKVFDVSKEYLVSGVTSTEESEDLQKFLTSAGLIFAGGKLSEEDKDKVMIALQRIYWEAKEINIKNAENDLSKAAQNEEKQED